MNKLKIEAIEILLDQYIEELDKQSWIHRRFHKCKECEELIKKKEKLRTKLEKFVSLGEGETK